MSFFWSKRIDMLLLQMWWWLVWNGVITKRFRRIYNVRVGRSLQWEGFIEYKEATNENSRPNG